MNDPTMMNTSTAASTIHHQCQKNQKRCRHLYAQKLNNSAAICLDSGLYDRAISSLSKALKLSEQQDEESEEQEDEEPVAEEQERNQEEQGNNQENNDDDDDVIMEEEDEAEDEDNKEEDESMTMVCPCYHSTIDGCIEYSEMNKSYFMTEKDSDNDESDGNDAFLCQAITDADTDTDADADTDTDSSSAAASYMYRRPIQVTYQTIQEEHNMGSTLCLMIAFNLALAYHLKAISMQKNNNNSSSSSSTHRHYLKYITVALKLYNHVLQWQARLIHQQHDNAYYHEESSATTIHSGMRFKMILLNNMSQLYRQHETSSSSSSYQLCLQSLLSNIMLVVEYKTRIFHHNNASLSSSLQLPYIMKADLERFIDNTSPLLMGNSGNGRVQQQDHCASVA